VCNRQGLIAWQAQVTGVRVDEGVVLGAACGSEPAGNSSRLYVAANLVAVALAVSGGRPKGSCVVRGRIKAACLWQHMCSRCRAQASRLCSTAFSAGTAGWGLHHAQQLW
jgi:hypothetical protein